MSAVGCYPRLRFCMCVCLYIYIYIYIYIFISHYISIYNSSRLISSIPCTVFLTQFTIPPLSFLLYLAPFFSLSLQFLLSHFFYTLHRFSHSIYNSSSLISSIPCTVFLTQFTIPPLSFLLYLAPFFSLNFSLAIYFL